MKRKRLMKFAEIDLDEIQQGDYVDFGPYGKRYVCNPNYDSHYFWVTDNRSQRNNPSARGWSMRKTDAEKVIETYEDFYDEDDDEYNDDEYYNDPE